MTAGGRIVAVLVFGLERSEQVFPISGAGLGLLAREMGVEAGGACGSGEREGAVKSRR